MKLLGGFLIVIASALASIVYEKKLRATIKFTDELYKLVLYIKNKIEYFSLSIDEIYSEYSSENELIKKGLNGKWDFSFLEKELIDDLEHFFASLGKGFKKEQIALCDYLLSKLIMSKECLIKETPKKIKIFRSLSYFAGFGIVILLI